MTVLIIVILVPIIVFATSQFITSSISRYATQTRTLEAMYLAQAGIHRAIYNIDTGALPTFGFPVSPDTGSTIDVTYVQSATQFGLTSIGASSLPAPSLSRKVYAKYDSGNHQISAYLEVLPTTPQNLFTSYGYKWGMDENTGTTTGTTPLIGTLTPAAARPTWVAGRVKNALRFNQTATNNYVLIPYNASLNFTTEGSMMAWIYLNVLPTVDNTAIVRRGRSDSTTVNETYALLLNRANATTINVEFSLTTASGGTRRLATGTTALAINTWYHVAGTWGPAGGVNPGLRVYLNGVQNGTNATVYSSFVPTTGTMPSILIGTLVTTSSSTKFNGTIDEVYVYGHQLSQPEILAYYNATKP